MSDLYSRLGPQGRALLEQSNSITTSATVTDSTPQELDFLIYELRNPKSDTSVSKILSYLYNYIPYIKYEHNLRVVFSSFLDNPVCFRTCNFQDNYLIIEVFKLIMDKKLRVSQPTLPIKVFYDILVKSLVHFVGANPIENSWKVLPIISGLWLSNTLRNEIYTQKNFIEYKWFFNNWDNEIMKLFKRSLSYSLARIHSNEVVYLSLISLAVVYQKEQEIHSYTRGIAVEFIINKILELMFIDEKSSVVVYSLFYSMNPQDLNSESVVEKEIFQKPVIKHLNKLSFLLEAYFSKLPPGPNSEKLIAESLFKLIQFNKKLSHSVTCSEFNIPTSDKASAISLQFWSLMKTILFSEIIIMQGILTRFLISKNTFFRNVSLEREYRDISIKILNNLYYINFILLSIGQGGFDNYNFVYYLSLELSQSTGEYFEQFSKRLMFDYNEINLYPDAINTNYIMSSKVLFVLGLWENYLQSNKTNDLFTNEIYETCLKLANEKYNNDILESSHSVILFYFSTNKNPNLKASLDYIQLLISQFPNKLSANQLNIAIETIGKRIMSTGSSDATEGFFKFLVHKCVQTRPGIPIKSSKSPQLGETGARTMPNTVREAAILTLIQLIPYFPLSKFMNWLDEIWLLIIRSNKQEGQFLESRLWNAIGENLDLNRSELGIRWWYNEKKLTERSFWTGSAKI